MMQLLGMLMLAYFAVGTAQWIKNWHEDRKWDQWDHEMRQIKRWQDRG